MDKSEEALSMLSIESTSAKQLERLDLALAEEYLAGASRKIESLREKIGNANNELLNMVARAAAAKDMFELRLINAKVASEACDLFLLLHSAPVVHQFCTVARGAIAKRALELARKELYFSGTSCELPLALLAVGSDGRGEQSLSADQDYLFLYSAADGAAARCEEEIDDYFGMLGSVFMTMLDDIGIEKCSGGIMPVNGDWRGSQRQWQERLAAMLRFERIGWEKNILNLIALMDVRFICGDRDIGLGFGTLVRSLVRNNPDAMRHTARVASSMKLSRGFLNRFIVEAEGIHKGEFNLKIMAWMPLIMCVRLLAVSLGIEETATLARLGRLRSEGHLPDKLACELIDAYHTITGHRILQQVKRFKRIIDDDCYINPYKLPGNEREELKIAIGKIEELQSMVRSRFSMATAVDRVITPVN